MANDEIDEKVIDDIAEKITEDTYYPKCLCSHSAKQHVYLTEKCLKCDCKKFRPN